MTLPASLTRMSLQNAGRLISYSCHARKNDELIVAYAIPQTQGRRGTSIHKELGGGSQAARKGRRLTERPLKSNAAVQPLALLPSFGAMLSSLCRRGSLRSSPPTLSPRARTWASVGAASKTKTVLIAGAGPVGLTLSALLSRYSVPNLVFEKSSKFSHHPQVSTGAGPREGRD